VTDVDEPEAEEPCPTCAGVGWLEPVSYAYDDAPRPCPDCNPPHVVRVHYTPEEP
jgi:hypothetical protein